MELQAAMRWSHSMHRASRGSAICSTSSGRPCRAPPVRRHEERLPAHSLATGKGHGLARHDKHGVPALQSR